MARSSERAAVQIATRIFAPGKGAKVAALCTATIRAVAQGVVGIAFIQMLLVGVGFAVMGVPAAGVLALAVLVFGIVQLPVSVITLPVIGFVMATEGATVATIAFAIYLFVAGAVDNVLKPMLLGRGVDVPMPVILIGSLGGMVTSGILGLFIGRWCWRSATSCSGNGSRTSRPRPHRSTPDGTPATADGGVAAVAPESRVHCSRYPRTAIPKGRAIVARPPAKERP
jgi:hypothetical protein